jgi:uncharacterized protein
MLTIIEENLEELAAGRRGLPAAGRRHGRLQRRGIQASPEVIEIHPGLARFLRERDAWDEAWDDRVAG